MLVSFFRGLKQPNIWRLCANRGSRESLRGFYQHGQVLLGILIRLQDGLSNHIRGQNGDPRWSNMASGEIPEKSSINRWILEGTVRPQSPALVRTSRRTRISF